MSAHWQAEAGRLQVQVQPGKLSEFLSQNKQLKRAGDGSQCEDSGFSPQYWGRGGEN